MPKRKIDDETPRRAGKGALAATPGLMMRLVMHSPKDFLAASVAFAAICAIVGNAVFMQAGRHPSPWFGTPSFSNAATPAIPNPLPRPRPLETVQPGERALDSRLFDGKPAELRAQPKAEPKPEVKSEMRPEPRVEPASAPMPAPRPEPKAVQRHADPVANLIRNPSSARAATQQASGQQAIAPQALAAASNPNIPRPPASVPTRGDPLGDLIAGRGR